MSLAMRTMCRQMMDHLNQRQVDEHFVMLVGSLTDVGERAATIVAYVPESHNWNQAG